MLVSFRNAACRSFSQLGVGVTCDGFFNAWVQSVRACVKSSTDDVCGIVWCVAKNSTVPPIRTALGFGTYIL